MVINNEDYLERAEIIREKGTNRSKFYRGEIDKYTWVDIGSSFLPSEFNVSYLYGQLQMADEINNNRIESWGFYYDGLKKLENKGIVELPKVPSECIHNAHMFYLKWKNVEQRSDFIDYMKGKEISCVFHYVPLHSSFGGNKYGRMYEKDRFTTAESERLVRLPMFYKMKKEECEYIIESIINFSNT